MDSDGRWLQSPVDIDSLGDAAMVGATHTSVMWRKHAGPQEMSLSSRKVWAFAQMCIRIRGGPPPTLSDVETCLADEDWLDDVTKGEWIYDPRTALVSRV